MTQESDSPLVVSSLVCHTHVPMAILCLGSLLKYHHGSIRIMIHDDGSCTDEDQALLQEGLPLAQVVRRKQADERMAEELRRFPASAAFRRESCMGLKLCDSVCYSQHDLYCYSDSDVLFIRPFKDLFHLPDTRTHAIFMHDSFENSYSFRSWQLLTARSVRLPQKVNAGLTCLRKSKYDPEFIEWFLAEPARGGRRHHGVPEQTAWAALGMHIGCMKWHPNSIAVGRRGLQVTPELVGIHFVGMFRHFMKDCLELGPFTNDLPVTPKLMHAHRCTSVHLAVDESRRVMSRMFMALKRK